MRRPVSATAIIRGVRAAAAATRLLALLLVGVFFASGITFVQPGEVALILRMGRLRGTTTADQIRQPGLLFALPYPIDEVLRVPVKREGEVVIEDLWRAVDGAADGDSINPLHEGYVLTGNQNLLQTKMAVKYRIDDPIDFRLRTVEPERVLRSVVLSALVHVVSGWSVDDVLRLQTVAEERAPAEIAASRSLAAVVANVTNERLKSLHTGVLVSALEFREMHPPRHVVEEFRKVQSARINTETMRRDAEGYAARQLPAAEAERNRLIQAATAVASGRTARARAEISEFEPLQAEYSRFPELVRQRLFQETLEWILEHVGQVKLVPPGTRPLLSDPEQRP